MIQLYPHEDETLVVAHPMQVVLQRLISEIDRPIEQGLPRTLTGWVHEDRFQLTIKIRRLQLFMPAINGKIESTSKGSLIFITYNLFPGTRLLLTFWSLMLPLLGFIISYQYKNYWLLAGLLCFLVFIHAVAWTNFKMHLHVTRQILHDLLNEE